MIRIRAPIIHEDDAGTVREWDVIGPEGPTGFTCYSIERPWKGNQPNISRIPNGIYSLIPWVSPKWGAFWTIVGGTVSPHKDDVPDHAERWGCLIHPANWPYQVEGCIALGDSWTPLHKPKQSPAVWNSMETVEAFRKVVHGESHMILYLEGP